METNPTSLFKSVIDLAPLHNPAPLSQANAVGQAVDVFARPDSFVRPLLDENKATTKLFSFQGKEFLIPSYITPIENPKFYHEGGTCMTRNEFQSSVAANASASASYGLFSGEMKASYREESSSSSEYAFSYTNAYSRLAELKLGDYRAFLNDNFAGRVAQLPATATKDNLDAFISFFKDFGIYYSDTVELGGSLRYHVSVKKTSELGKSEITAMMEAQYKGAFVSGKISADITKTNEWKRYSENMKVHIEVIGGNATHAAALSHIDPQNPSQMSVDVYKAWVDSVAQHPALTKAALSGIWNLCGDRKNAVESAWKLFAETIHPKITIETASKAITTWPLPTPVTPIITFNGAPVKPAKAPASPVGFQAVFLSNTGGVPQILETKYIELEATGHGWHHFWPKFYTALANELSSNPHNKKNNILLLTSYGLGRNISPTQPAYEFLKLNGAGMKLEYWLANCNPGSQGGTTWMTGATNYMLITQLGHGPNVGTELLQSRLSPDDDRIKSEIECFLFKDSVIGNYTVGA